MKQWERFKKLQELQDMAYSKLCEDRDSERYQNRMRAIWKWYK